jgi:type IV pilus assembly protein PilA
MKSIQKGFTLIELMIVVAIIAILAAIAISQYQDYVIRSQVSEGSSLADGMKTAVTEFYNNNGRFASTAVNTSYGLSAPASIQGTYVDTVTVLANSGKIQAHFSATTKKANSKIDGSVLSFSPVTHAGSIEWTCTTSAGTSATLLDKWRSTICRG